MAVNRVKVWQDTKSGEVRIYVNTESGGDGCLYVTGNRFQAKGTVTGNLSQSDWAEARAKAIVTNGQGKRVWRSWYPETAQTPRPQAPARRPSVNGLDRIEDTRHDLEEYDEFVARQERRLRRQGPAPLTSPAIGTDEEPLN